MCPSARSHSRTACSTGPKWRKRRKSVIIGSMSAGWLRPCRNPSFTMLKSGSALASSMRAWRTPRGTEMARSNASKSASVPFSV